MKEPVLQLFVMPTGLPARRGIRVTVLDGETTLAATVTSDRRDPLFAEPLELWGAASGKNASLPLTFSITAEDDNAGSSSSQPLAIAKIKSDELRKYGLYDPREGAAVALPLVLPADAATSEPLPRDAALHCYVHVGYSVRRERPSGSSARGGAPSSADPKVGGGTLSSPTRPKRPPIQITYAIRPSDDPIEMVLRVAGRNTSRQKAVQLLKGSAAIELKLSEGSPWHLVDAYGPPELDGVILPPRGLFEATYVLRLQDSTNTNENTPPSAEFRVQYEAVIDDEEMEVVDLSDAADAAPPPPPTPTTTGKPQSISVNLPLPVTLLYPFVVSAHEMTPQQPLVGSSCELRLTLAWPALLRQLEAKKSSSLEGDAEAWMLLEVEMVSAHEWALLGEPKQILRVHIRGGEDDANKAAASSELRWNAVPLSSGVLPLPALRLTRLGSSSPRPSDESLAMEREPEEPLPMPPYLKGGTVKVARAGV